MGIHIINNMKKIVWNSPLQTSNKSKLIILDEETPAKTMIGFNVQKSEIICVTGHDTDWGLDPCSSTDDNQQQGTLEAIGHCSHKITAF